MQEVANKSGGWYLHVSDAYLQPIVCGFKRFLVEKNGEGTLDSLAVGYKRYHFNWFLKVLFELCILTLCNLCCFFLWVWDISNCDNMWITFFKRKKCLLFARDVIYLELMYSCHMIFLESANIWILYPNL